MKVYFIGSMYPQELIEYLRKTAKSDLDNAAHNFQLSIIEGLDEFIPNLTLVTHPSIRTYPKYYKRILVKGLKFTHNGKSQDISFRFINIHLVKHLMIFKNLMNYFRKELNKNDEEYSFILYGLTSPFLRLVHILKDKGYKINACLIVPDLPEFMLETNNLIYKYLKKIDKLLIHEYIKSIDSFVLLNENMYERLPIQGKRWIRMEGIVNNDHKLHKALESTFKVVLYTGNIDERYGIKYLIDAFSLITNENYQLWIRGIGNTLEYVKKASEMDNRIKIFDEMPIDKLFELMSKATLLINVVPPNLEFSKYFFPSKILNYMLTGIPVLSSRIEGIPNEYYKHLYVIDDFSIQGIRNIIIDTCEKDNLELEKMGDEARKFILEFKNSRYQSRRIIDLMYENQTK